ncbi:YdcF family protein [Lachnoclostridium sp. Marseille-P6806]|uniref:YdcF family protein n=1 Tax=Lachnoclostridium sp. Marseille-P6806 TaxID=2364793 RepID=UPI0010316D9B|nr:YdcF family protein [Lachnoclostridium sp. Marseille-P6806]
MLHVLYIVLALLCLFYGVCVLLTGSGTSFYLVWIALGLLFAGGALVQRFHLWGRFPAAVRAGVLISAGVFGLTVLITWLCLLPGCFAGGEPGLDYLVVLGAQVRPTGPSGVLRYRLDTACDYLAENPDTLCIVSGGQGANEPEPEGAAMKKYLVQRGIAAERIIEENQSGNTVENIRNSSAYFNAEEASVGIVTNNFHVFRGVRIARKAGYGWVCGIAAPSVGFYLPNNMLRETFGIVKDWAAGNL